ncbi:MAG: AbrB/MazE/SpoVT family DNA-binding domain-containing protein [Burkholderiales bacterium]|nr:AbrB/MazE/SpoVT family DNA-binding domain-containing protein [Burkholderiales bacterium]
MKNNEFAASSLVKVNGQIVVPQSVLDVIGVQSGHHQSVTFVVENNTVRLVNSAAFAMQQLQQAALAAQQQA